MSTINQKSTNAYFDTQDLNLAKNDIWLRKRGDLFELLIPIFGSEKESSNQFQKIEGEQKIREIFAVVPMKSFIEDIADLGYASFFEIENFSNGIDFSLERKKVLEFLKTKKPESYQVLVDTGIVE